MTAVFGSELDFLTDHGFELLIKVLSAVIAGFLLGYERQRRGKSVGILTAILVALGSMLFVQAGVILTQMTDVGGDSIRIGSTIVSGIGFIGAGAIMRSKFNVTGLASAATIWSLGGLGILIGWGYLLTSISVSVIIFLLLRFVPAAEHKLFKGRMCMHLDVVLKADRYDVVRDFLRENQVSLADAGTVTKGDEMVLSINECGMESTTGILDSLTHLDGVIDVVNRHP
ncbi:MAG: MgtC/SapB family protein [Fidelibacterota bacterium]